MGIITWLLGMVIVFLILVDYDNPKLTHVEGQ